MGGDHLLGTVPSIWKDFVLGTRLSGNSCIFGTLGGGGYLRALLVSAQLVFIAFSALLVRLEESLSNCWEENLQET